MQAAPLAYHQGYADGHGLRLHYTEWGPPDAPVLLLLHGMGAHGMVWGPVARGLSHRYRCIAPDARGHGNSGWAERGGYVSDLHFADISVFLASLGIAQAAVCGHSMGSAAAIQFAGSAPDRCSALIVVDAYPDPVPSAGSEAIARYYACLPERFPTWQEARRSIGYLHADGIEAGALDLALRELSDGGYAWRIDPAIREEFRDWVEQGTALQRSDLWPFWRAVQSPALVVRGSRSHVLTETMANRMVAERPGARLVTLEGGHGLPLECPAELASVILRFLDEECSWQPLLLD